MSPSNQHNRTENQSTRHTSYADEDDFDEVDLAFTEEELTSKSSSLPQAPQQAHQPTRPTLTASNTNSNEDDEDDFEEVDLPFTEQELTRKNSFDFVVDEKKRNDEIHDFLHGKAEVPKVSVPAPTLAGSRGDVRRYGQSYQVDTGEEMEMTDFSSRGKGRGRDLESGLGDEDSKKEGEGEGCRVM